MLWSHDPSVQGWGWAVLDVNGWQVVDTGVIRTKSRLNQNNVRKGQDNHRRITEIVQRLQKVYEMYNPKCVAVEQPGGSRNASSAKMLGLVGGVIYTVSELWEIPTELYTPHKVKKNMTEDGTATKKEMIEGVKEEYGIHWPDVKYKREAIADAIAVAHCAREWSEIIKMFK